MTTNKTLFFCVALLLVSIGLSAWAYPHAPDLVPSHWGPDGRVNGHLPKLWGLFLLPAVMAMQCTLVAVLPRISPRGFSMQSSLTVFNIVMGAVTVVMLWAELMIVGAAVGVPGASPNVLVVLVGALIALIGNYLPKVRKNFFLGIRTPWTLASDEVWLRTHRFGGWVFTIGGIAVVVFGLLGSVLPLTIVLLAVVATPIVYSFVIYKRIEGFAADGNGQA